MKIFFLSSLMGVVCLGNPYPDPNQVPKDKPWVYKTASVGRKLNPRTAIMGYPEMLVEIGWKSGERFQLNRVALQRSGSEALKRRAKNKDLLGSYRGELWQNGTAISFSSVGTGAEFRKLNRDFTFRFPTPNGAVQFKLVAENPSTGKMETVFETEIQPSMLLEQPVKPADEVRLLRNAEKEPALWVNIYAEGYHASRKSQFFSHAANVVSSLESINFPGQDRMEFKAVFVASNQKLGRASDLGMPIKGRDTFLGLYFPYWHKFGRWYHVVYPTKESKFREGISRVPYDYAIVLADNSSYWGVGNFNEHTVVPSSNSSFTYLLHHEFGHFFGLNEEYESGGPTELAFAKGISEPWSQNITFQPSKANLKWSALVSSNTPIPTPRSQWTGSGPYGAYRGGYAGTGNGKSHKPGYSCIMSSDRKFCPICKQAIAERVKFDLGQ